MSKQFQYSILDTQGTSELPSVSTQETVVHLNERRKKITHSKSTSAVGPTYQTIGDVSKLLDVPTHVLRFWESKFSEIKPIKRSNGHRYYRAQDIDVITKIKALLYDKKFTISGAKAALKETKGQKIQPTAPQKTIASLDQELRGILKDIDQLRKVLGESII